ncbi:MAG: hypothetical protein AAFS11_00955 [Planctomycetota bacterium]
MTTHDSGNEGQAMISTDALRLLTGVGAIAAAAGIGVYLFVAGPRSANTPDSTLSPDVVLTAAQAGMDLTDGSPAEDADRLRAAFDAGKATPAGTITFRNSLYLTAATDEAPEQVLTGYLSTMHDSGSPALIAGVVDGTLQGPAVTYYSSGTIKAAMNHKDGAIIGQYIEYFETGEMKLRAVASGEDSPNGGSAVAELTVGTYEEGKYTREELGKGRLQLFTGNGTTTGSNADTPLHEVTGWMLFHNTLLTGQKLYTNDSRTITAPAS